MTLQDRFEEIIHNCTFPTWDDMAEVSTAKECTKLCLEEQIILLVNIIANITDDVSTIMDIHLSAKDILYNLKQQLKELENGTTNSK